MPRAAGNDSRYEWRLFNKHTQEYDVNETIEFPSVTTIIKATLAAPAIVGWSYRTTRDNIAAYLAYRNLQIDERDVYELLQTWSDPDLLEDFLKANRLRPDDIKDDAAERGKVGHSYLEDLCALQPEDAMDMAYGMAKETNGWEVAIGRWWIARQPTVVASEVVLRSLHHGFAGTVDLVYKSAKAPLTVTDLKTRKEGSYAYSSDDIQTGGYAIAWNEMHPANPVKARSILVARADGTYSEVKAKTNEQTFLNLLDVYNDLKGFRYGG